MNITQRMAAFDLSKLTGSKSKAIADDTVLGDMSEPLRRIFGLYLSAQERVRVICTEYQALSSELEHAVSERHGMVTGDDEPKLTRLEELKRQYEVVVPEAESFNWIFWGAVRLEFPAPLTKGVHCVVDGFKVVWRPCDIVSIPLPIALGSIDPFGCSGFGRS